MAVVSHSVSLLSPLCDVLLLVVSVVLLLSVPQVLLLLSLPRCARSLLSKVYTLPSSKMLLVFVVAAVSFSSAAVVMDVSVVIPLMSSFV